MNGDAARMNGFRADTARSLPDGPVRTRPGDAQPFGPVVHIAHGSGGELPGRYLCGTPVRALIARIQPGHPPRGSRVCPICAFIDEAGA